MNSFSRSLTHPRCSLVAVGLAMVLAAVPVAAQAAPDDEPALSPDRHPTPALLSVPGDSSAWDINDRGQIVGWSTTAEGRQTSHAFLWRPRSGRMADLGTLEGFEWGGAYGINESSLVVGYVEADPPDWSSRRASVWSPDTRTMADLLGPTGPVAMAVDTNEKGQVVGWFGTSEDGRHPFLWRPGSGRMVDLGTIGNERFSEARAINNRGDVLGVASGPSGRSGWHPWLWRAETRELVRLGDRRGFIHDSEPYDMNDKGQIVACTWDDGYHARTFLWRPKSQSILRLGSLGGGQACAWGINDQGQVVGWSTNERGNTRAFLWRPRSRAMVGLGTLRGASAAKAINAHHEVVGWSGRYPRQHAFLWNPKTDRMKDLGTLADG